MIADAEDQPYAERYSEAVLQIEPRGPRGEGETGLKSEEERNRVISNLQGIVRSFDLTFRTDQHEFRLSVRHSKLPGNLEVGPF